MDTRMREPSAVARPAEAAFVSSPVFPPATLPPEADEPLMLATSYCVALGLFRWERERRWGLVQAHAAMRVRIEAAFADIRDRALRLSSAEHAASVCVETWARGLALAAGDPDAATTARAMRTTVWSGAWTGHHWKTLACLRGPMSWPRQRADRDVSLSLASWLELRLQEFHPADRETP